MKQGVKSERKTHICTHLRIMSLQNHNPTHYWNTVGTYRVPTYLTRYLTQHSSSKDLDQHSTTKGSPSTAVHQQVKASAVNSRHTAMILPAAAAPADSVPWSSRACSWETASQTPAAVSALITDTSHDDIVTVHSPDVWHYTRWLKNLANGHCESKSRQIFHKVVTPATRLSK